MEPSLNLLDLNTAGRIELMNLPGVGGALADRIIAARPFCSYEELQQVRGVRPSLLEALSPYITLSPLPEAQDKSLPQDGILISPPPVLPLITYEHPEAIEPGVQTINETEEYDENLSAAEASASLHLPTPTLTAPLSPADEEEETEAPVYPSDETASTTAPGIAAAPVTARSAAPGTSFIASSNEALHNEIPSGKYFTRSQVLGVVFTSGLLSFILAVFFVLSVLVLTNGGLRFASQEDAGRLTAEINGLRTDSVNLQTRVADMSQRLDGLQALDERVSMLSEDFSAVEEDVAGLNLLMETFNQQIEGLAVEVETFSQRTEALAAELEAVSERTAGFQSFLSELYALLGNTLSSGGQE